ncbi:hypothetical protein [Paraburkholderia fynbosensis]|uniref:hypothetical protein n=1 Tax=Paraburkholderia fynbosensis TaxID=1200993 RepID=UPI00158373AB|nr:hypothetical protein [Paraburkholderia fynbosensis]
MLEDHIGIDQIEHSVEIRQRIIGSNEFDIPDALPGDVFFAAYSSMDGETSIPTALFARVDKGMIKRPTPQPKSAAQSARKSGFKCR